MRLKLLILFAFAALCATSQPVPYQPGIYPADINTNYTTLSNVFIVNQNNATLKKYKVTGTTAGWYLGNVSNAIFYIVGRQNINGGIAYENCKNVTIIAPDSVVLLSGGVPFVIKAHADSLQASGLIILNGINGAAWIKEDAAQACDYPDPLNYLYPNHQRNIWFTDFRIGNPDGSNANGGEGLYIGSTGSYGRDQVPCLGNQIYKPMYENGIHVLRGNVYNQGRTTAQISGADSGQNEIQYVNSFNAGRELNSSQGGAFRTGYGTNNTTIIAHCRSKYSYIYGLDIETGANVHDNNVDSSGWYDATHKNPQQIPSVICYALLPNSILKLQYNTAGANSAQPFTNFAIYGSANYSTTGNQICNNTGNVAILSLPFNYTTDCGAIIDTGCVNKDTTFFRDSYVTGHFDSTFTDSIGKVWVPEKWQTKVQKNGKYRQIIIGDSVITHFTVLVRAAYDSVYICSLCQKVDTTICVPIIRTVGYGAFILDGYNSLTTTAQKLHYAKATLQVPNLRENWSFGNVWQNQQYLDSGINPIATMSSSQINGTPHSFPTNATAVQDTVTSKFANSKPPIAGWENEPGTILYWDSTGGGIFQANQYKIGYYAFIAACNAAGVKSVDGAITYPVIYSLADYYQRNGKSDSLTYLSTATGIMNFTNMPLKIYWRDFFNTLLPIIRNGNADYVQFHMYGDTLSVPNKLLTVLLNYIVQQTGKQIVTFETGTDLTGHADFNSFMTEWTKQNPAYMLYYLSASSPPVTNESYFIQFKTNNP